MSADERRFAEIEAVLIRIVEWIKKQPQQCPHIPPCFENSDGCWNYDEAKKRVDAYPNFP